jgi:hypothetical protein
MFGKGCGGGGIDVRGCKVGHFLASKHEGMKMSGS